MPHSYARNCASLCILALLFTSAFHRVTHQQDKMYWKIKKKRNTIRWFQCSWGRACRTAALFCAKEMAPSPRDAGGSWFLLLFLSLPPAAHTDSEQRLPYFPNRLSFALPTEHTHSIGTKCYLPLSSTAYFHAVSVQISPSSSLHLVSLQMYFLLYLCNFIAEVP